LLSQSNIEKIAELHISNIDYGFISSLGVDFLVLVYEAMNHCDECFLLAEFEGNQLVGFVSGGESLVPIYKRLMSEPVKLLFSLIPHCLNATKLVGLYNIIRHIIFKPKLNLSLPDSDLPPSIAHTLCICRL
jgi:hypothetical protein